MKKFVLVLMVGFLLTACSSLGNKKNKEVYNYNYAGTLAPLEMSIWQYGTHTFTTESREFYAVKSETINLDEYLGKPVYILGDVIDGYPVDSGPIFVDIKKVQLMEK